MSEQELRSYVVNLVNECKETHLLEEIRSILEGGSGDWWDDLTEADQQSLEQGLKESRDGKMIPHEQAMEETWRTIGK